MICQCWLLLVIIYARDVHSSPRWIGGQINYSPGAYRIQNNPFASRDKIDVPIEPDAAFRIEKQNRPYSTLPIQNAYLPPISPKQRLPSNQQQQEDTMPSEIPMNWQNQVASYFTCL